MTAPAGNTLKTVVIAEDNTAARRAIKSQIESLGYDVVGSAMNGEVAVELALKLQPSLVIMDIKMPRMDGIEAARTITANSPLPIILVTGHTSEELATEAIEAGVFAYLLKPISTKDLMPAIKLALTRYSEFNELRKEVSTLKDAIEARKFIERAKGILMKRCKLDEEEAYKLMQTQSQKENRKMREIAEMVISASKLI